MTDDECIHGMTRAWCSACRTSTTTTPPSKAASDPYGGRSRQLLYDDLCALLDVPRYVPGPGSTPSRVFSAAAAQAKVEITGSMPEIGEAIAAKAGLTWGPGCDNGGMSQHPTAVTRDGVGVVVQALTILAKAGSLA